MGTEETRLKPKLHEFLNYNSLVDHTGWNSQGGSGNETSHIFINVPLYHGIFLNVLKIGRWSWPGKTFTGADWTKWGTRGKRSTVVTWLSAQLFHFGAVLIWGWYFQFIVKLLMGNGWYNHTVNEISAKFGNHMTVCPSARKSVPQGNQCQMSFSSKWGKHSLSLIFLLLCPYQSC